VAVLIAIVAGAALAFWFPEAVLWIAPALGPAFAVTMLMVGTLVRAEQLGAFRATPSRPFVGLAAQYTIMPLLAFAASFLVDDPVQRTGIVLVGCMPGAMASNVMTLLLRGDLVLSVTMTTVATLCTPVILLLWLPVLCDTRIDVPVASLAWNATWMVVIPVVLGGSVRHLLRRMPRWWDRVAALTASASIVVIILVVVAKNRAQLAELGLVLVVAMVALNLGGYASAYGVAHVLGWPGPQRRTLVVEVGMQNAGLGSVLALQNLGATGALPSAFYTALCVVTAAAALPWINRWGGRPHKPAPAARHED
jgi:BASS family bile acid:Na+ symporter